MIKFKDKTLIEQIKEAEKHTTTAEAMTKCSLAQTAYDHLVRGGTPSDRRMWNNPNTPLIDLMSDQEIEAKVEQFYRICNSNYTREVYEADVVSEIQRESSVEKSPLANIILFLSEVRRLPEKYKHLIT